VAHVRRFDHVGITVADLDAVTAFFVGLGLEVEGRMFVEGEFLDTVIGISDSRTEIVMLRPPGGGTLLELSSFVRPAHEPGSTAAMANELGLRNVAFEVDDLQAAVDGLAAQGGRVTSRGERSSRPTAPLAGQDVSAGDPATLSETRRRKRWRAAYGSPQHAIGEVRRSGRHHRPDPFKGDRRVEHAEQGRTGTKQDPDNVHLDLVEEAERERLLHDGRAEQADDLLARHVPSPLDRACHAVGDEREHG